MFENLFELSTASKIVLFVLFGVSVYGLYYLKKQDKVKFTTKMLVVASMCIALSFVLSHIRLFRLPQAGSITAASMLPMFLFAVMFGPKAGIIAGVAYGFLQFIQDGYVIHEMQFLLDYPLAFGAMGLAGLYKKNIAIASLIGGLARTFMHFLSGFIFFGMYAPEGMNPVIYSFIYNISTSGVDTLIVVLLCFVPQIKTLLKRLQTI
ncbi:MAG: energy-coupled thiamine transporter ThiT [Alkaliphilus sp.]|nr:energy-coupled thiamine transporter ThiT [bacterium AH-315-L21]MBN4069805.1 energy-coupled thiamine transporter ThiT [bacterium AH-315-G05]MBN4074776.1 energy-coupled thiamine transporter ThiT [bacterium AH-315-E09]PHS30121.1 MAG: energy-coupled thiamine transporter ThiT [Alkaliphilus sp.]